MKHDDKVRLVPHRDNDGRVAGHSVEHRDGSVTYVATPAPVRMSLTTQEGRR